MKLKSKQTAVFGMKGEGKSNWVQHILSKSQYSNHLVYDVTGEHDVDGVNRYLPTHRRGDKANAELNEVAKKMVTQVSQRRRPELFVVEEMSRFCGTHSPPPPEIYELIDMNRHYGVGVVFVARRPAQVHPDVFELADNTVLFHLEGPNDVRKMNQYRDGLGDRMKDLDLYHYLTVQGRDTKHHSPVPEMDSTGDL